MGLFTTTPTARQIDTGLAVLRVIVGIIFIAHGAQKLFQFGFAGVSGAFGQMGIPLAGITGPMVGIVEFFGGLALALGFLTRLAAIGLAVVMLGAMSFVHIRAGFFAPAGVEFPLSLFAANLALFIMGPGAWSIDRAVDRRGTTTV